MVLCPVLSFFLAASTPLPEVPLYPERVNPAAKEAVRETAAGDRVVSQVHNPSIKPYLPSKPTGFGVVIAPGGGHRELWTTHEGHNIAQWLSERGVAAFVLKYRLARDKDSNYTIEGDAFDDTKQALALVRQRAGEWMVEPAKVGVMGFSAGGELAALAGTRFQNAVERPAFQVLVYPAIPKEMPLSKATPPAFLICGENDRQNISNGLPELYLAMRKAGVSAELHVYSGVGHGFGFRPTLTGPVASWLQRFHDWLLNLKPGPAVPSN